MLENSVFLCQTFRSGALATGCHIKAASLVPHRFFSLRMLVYACVCLRMLEYACVCLRMLAYACVCLVHFGQEKKVSIYTVSEALSAVGKIVDLSY